MIKLCETSTVFEAALITERLAQAEIPCSYGDLHQISWQLGVAASVPVFIERQEDWHRATEIANETVFATRLDTEDGSPPRCFGCGYDLRGHSGEGKCPECGHPYRTGRAALEPAHPRWCPDCGAELPPGFEVCWRCAGDDPDVTADAATEAGVGAVRIGEGPGGVVHGTSPSGMAVFRRTAIIALGCMVALSAAAAVWGSQALETFACILGLLVLAGAFALVARVIVRK